MDSIGIAVSDIRLTNWVVGDAIPFLKPTGTKMDFQTHLNSIPIERKIRIRNEIRMQESTEDNSPFLSGVVETDFLLNVNDNQIKSEQIDIPDQAMITMISIAISHARALFLAQTKASSIGGIVLPLLNPTEIYKNIKAEIEKQKEVNKPS